MYLKALKGSNIKNIAMIVCCLPYHRAFLLLANPLWILGENFFNGFWEAKVFKHAQIVTQVFLAALSHCHP